jgi:hypothetical protein
MNILIHPFGNIDWGLGSELGQVIASALMVLGQIGVSSMVTMWPVYCFIFLLTLLMVYFFPNEKGSEIQRSKLKRKYAIQFTVCYSVYWKKLQDTSNLEIFPQNVSLYLRNLWCEGRVGRQQLRVGSVWKKHFKKENAFQQYWNTSHLCG